MDYPLTIHVVEWISHGLLLIFLYIFITLLIPLGIHAVTVTRRPPAAARPPARPRRMH